MPAQTINSLLVWLWRVAVCGLLLTSISAQTPPPPAQDPLLSLLLSQPRMELSRPVRVTATFDPPVVRPGQRSVYRVVLTAIDDAIDWPERLPVTPEVPVRAGARAQLLQMNGPVMEARTGLNFHFEPKQPGRITVPSFVIRVYDKPVTVPAAQLEVSPSAPDVPTLQMVTVDPSPRQAYVGEPVRVRVLLPAAAGVVQVLSQVQIIGQGLVVDKSAVRQSIEPVGDGSPNRVAYVYEISATPIVAGPIRFYAQGWSPPTRPAPAPGPGVALASGMLEYTLMDSDPVEIVARPLPAAGLLPGFTGAVGSFSVDPPFLLETGVAARGQTNFLKVGEPVKLAVTIRGGGNIARLVPPPPPSSPDWQVLPAQVDRSTPQLLHAKGAISFTYTLMALSDQVAATPEIPFVFFDPAANRYTTSNIPPVPVRIAPGGDTHARQTILAARTAAETSTPDLVLSGLATVPGASVSTLLPLPLRPWFPLVQIAPAIAFLALWAWDRRRRYLAAHPGLVARRRARRALRRERRALNAALNASHATEFERRAVRAFQVACAPIVGAEPTALVRADVLPVLKGQGASAEELEAVRQLFAASDADAFAPHTGHRAEILALAPELNRALDRSDHVLCH